MIMSLGMTAKQTVNKHSALCRIQLVAKVAIMVEALSTDNSQKYSFSATCQYEVARYFPNPGLKSHFRPYHTVPTAEGLRIARCLYKVFTIIIIIWALNLFERLLYQHTLPQRFNRHPPIEKSVHYEASTFRRQARKAGRNTVIETCKPKASAAQDAVSSHCMATQNGFECKLTASTDNCYKDIILRISLQTKLPSLRSTQTRHGSEMKKFQISNTDDILMCYLIRTFAHRKGRS
jgi:hypothetical protein